MIRNFGAKYCDLRICMSVCPLACVENHTTKLREIFCAYTCYRWPWFDPQICIKYSRFITCQSNTSKGRGDDGLPN